jgi:hypothetical protein
MHNEELHKLYSSPNIIRMIKLRRIRWAGYITYMASYRVLVWKPEGKRPLWCRWDVMGVMILLKVLTTKFVKCGTSQFPNFHVNFHKFHALSRLSQVLCKTGFENVHGCAQNTEYGFGFDFFTTKPQRWHWISRSHCMSNMWWNLGFVCECWNQKAVKAVNAHTFTKQAKKV